MSPDQNNNSSFLDSFHTSLQKEIRTKNIELLSVFKHSGSLLRKCG
jgi:hypothetical protein